MPGSHFSPCGASPARVLNSTPTLPDEPNESRASTPLAFRVVRGGVAVALTSYFLFAFGFLSNLVLTRLLAPADFGVLALGTFFFALLNLRPKLGIDQAFAQHAVTDAESSGTFAALSIASGIASFVLTLIALPILGALGYSQPVIVVTLALAGVGIMDSIMGIAWVQLDKALLFSRVSLVTAVAFPLAYLPAFYLAFNNGGYWALLAPNIAYAFLLLIGLWFTARRALPEVWKQRWTFSRALAAQFLRFGIFVGLGTIFLTLVYQFDNFLVGTFVNVEALGYYDRAYRIAQWSYVLVASVIARTAFYTFTNLQNDAVRLERAVNMLLWIVTTLTVPVALAIFVAADDLVFFLFGEKWLPSALLLKFLIAYSVLRPLLDNAGALFTALGHPRRATILAAIQAFALVLAATPLTLQFGAVGTAIGVGIAFVIGLLVAYYFVRRTLPNLSLRDAFLVPFVAAGITLVVALFASSLLNMWQIPKVIELFFKALFTLATFWAITFLLSPRGTRERAAYVWNLIRQRVV